MKARIIVTGGAGFIGSHLVEKLMDENYQVTVIDNLSSGNEKNINKRANFVKKDITNLEIPNLIKKINPDYIFHLAAKSSINHSLKNPSEDIRVNLLGTQNVLEALKNTKVKKIIFTSSAAVYKPTDNLPIVEEHKLEPVSFYGTSKLCSEFLIKNFSKHKKVNYVIFRLANVYGQKQNSSAEGGVVAIFIKNILKNKQSTIYGDGNQTRDFIYIADIIQGFTMGLNSSIVGTFNLGTAKQTSLLSLFSMICKIAGTSTGYQLKPLSHLEVKRNSLSSQKFKTLTGWNLTHHLNTGLKKTFDYFKNIA